MLHIPSLDAVITGDVIYNGINPFLAASGPEEWRAWIASVAKVAALEPRIVIAGHKRPELPDDDLTATLDATRDYIQTSSTSSSSAATHGTWSPACNAATPTTATRAR